MESQQSSAWSKAQEAIVSGDHDRHSLLLFRIGQQGQGAIPLSSVQRLEEFSATTVEYSCGREVVQCRDQILPLVRIGKLLDLEHQIEHTNLLQVIVHASEEGLVGLVVDGIIDIVEEEITTFSRQDGQRIVRGSAVVKGRVTDMVDMDEVIVMSRSGLLRVDSTVLKSEARLS